MMALIMVLVIVLNHGCNYGSVYDITVFMLIVYYSFKGHNIFVSHLILIS